MDIIHWLAIKKKDENNILAQSTKFKIFLLYN